jgi:hypothetical protein
MDSLQHKGIIFKIGKHVFGRSKLFFKASSVLQTRYLHSNQNVDLRLAFGFLMGTKHNMICATYWLEAFQLHVHFLKVLNLDSYDNSLTSLFHIYKLV